MIRSMRSDLNEQCCPDFTKRVCFACRANIRTRLAILAHNLAVVGALEETWMRCAMTATGGSTWRPGENIKRPEVILCFSKTKRRR